MFLQFPHSLDHPVRKRYQLSEGLDIAKRMKHAWFYLLLKKKVLGLMEDHTVQRTGENSCCCNEPDEHQGGCFQNIKCIQNFGWKAWWKMEVNKALNLFTPLRGCTWFHPCSSPVNLIHKPSNLIMWNLVTLHFSTLIYNLLPSFRNSLIIRAIMYCKIHFCIYNQLLAIWHPWNCT
jgi:hypothetical protein